MNPEPDCETLEATIGRTRHAEEEVRSIVEEALKDGRAKRISVFSRDLTTLRYVAINEMELFDPASLLKIPLLMAYEKYAEVDPNVLAKNLTYLGEEDLNANQEMQSFDVRTQLINGQQYSVGNLLERMIKYSDNNATLLLYENIETGFLERIMLDLGIRIPKQDMMGNRDFVTSKSFASIFRTLYNSSYLSRESSEKSLSLFSQSTFEDGIRAVVPKDVPIAEKYGERSVYDEKGALQYRELHECGIAYAKNGPFSFCIFTEGADFETLKSLLQKIGKTLYTDMSSDAK